MPDRNFTARVDGVRRFNRFYTQRIGVLDGTYQGTPFSLTQARVLYELIHRKRAAASDIARDLGLDDGYLSRILRGFEKDGLLRRENSREDARRSHLTASAKGRQKFAALEQATRSGIGEMLRQVPEPAQRRIVAAMDTITGALAHEPAAAPIMREPRPGDFGWIVARHGAIYAQEYGWTGPEFEALCAQIVSDFAKSNDPARERCWIAERGGENAGCAMVVKDSQHIARIRLVLVEPWARGLGIGKRLTEECLAFARSAGYRNVTLWTHSVLVDARRIYQRAGFKLTATKKHNDWGTPVVGETWDLKF